MTTTSLPDTDGHRAIYLHGVKKGEYVRRTIGGKVFIRGEYDRASKRYEICAAEDVNHCLLVKRNKKVFIGFTY